MKFPPRLSLKTLFVLIALVTIPIGWIAHQLNWIRERHAFLNRPNWQAMQPPVPPHSRPQAPWSLQLFGESPQDVLAVHEPDHNRAEELFPEAIIVATEP